MKVSVKKDILFNLLKNKLNENRTENVYMFGVASASGSPFGEEDEDLPIQPTHHVATQLSRPAPPVDDPDWEPGNIQELQRAIEELVRYVPDTPNAIQDYYRKAHRFLDEVTDSEEERKLQTESINISEQTKIRDFNILSESLDNDDKKTLVPFDMPKEELKGEDYDESYDVPQEISDANFKLALTAIKERVKQTGSEDLIKIIMKDEILEDQVPYDIVEDAFKIYLLTLEKDLEEKGMTKESIVQTIKDFYGTVAASEVFKDSFRMGYVAGHNFFPRVKRFVGTERLDKIVERQIQKYIETKIYKGNKSIKFIEQINETFNVQAFQLGFNQVIDLLAEDKDLPLSPESEAEADRFLATDPSELEIAGSDIPLDYRDQNESHQPKITEIIADLEYQDLYNFAPKALVDAVKETDIFFYSLIKKFDKEDAAVSLGRRAEGFDETGKARSDIIMEPGDEKRFPLHIKYGYGRFSFPFKSSNDIFKELQKNTTGSGKDDIRLIDSPEKSKEHLYNLLKEVIIDKALTFKENSGFAAKIESYAEKVRKEILADLTKEVTIKDEKILELEKNLDKIKDKRELLIAVSQIRRLKGDADSTAKMHFKTLSEELDGVGLLERILENFAESYYFGALKMSNTRDPITGEIDKEKFFNRVLNRYFGMFKNSQIGVNVLNAIFAKYNLLRRDKNKRLNPYMLFRTKTLNRLIDDYNIADIEKGFMAYLGFDMSEYEEESPDPKDDIDHGVPGLKSLRAAMQSLTDSQVELSSYRKPSEDNPGMFYIQEVNLSYSDMILTDEDELFEKVQAYVDDLLEKANEYKVERGLIVLDDDAKEKSGRSNVTFEDAFSAIEKEDFSKISKTLARQTLDEWSKMHANAVNSGKQSFKFMGTEYNVDMTQEEADEILNYYQVMTNFKKKKDYDQFSRYLKQKGAQGSRQVFLSGPMRKLNILKLCKDGQPEFLEMMDSIFLKVLEILNTEIDSKADSIKKDGGEKIKSRLQALIDKEKKSGKGETRSRTYVKKPGSEYIVKILEEAKEDIAKLYLHSRKQPMESGYASFHAIDLIDETHQLAYTPGGFLVREMVGQIVDKASKAFEKGVLEEIADELIKISEKKAANNNNISKLTKTNALSVAEYFIGMKNYPDRQQFETIRMRSSSSTKANPWRDYFGITDHLTFERELGSFILNRVILSSMADFMYDIVEEFDKSEGKKVVTQEPSGMYSSVAYEIVSKISSNSKDFEKAVISTIAEYQNYEESFEEYSKSHLDKRMTPLKNSQIPKGLDFQNEIKRLRNKILSKGK